MLGVERGEPWKSQDGVTEATVIITGHIPPASVTDQDMSRIQLATGSLSTLTPRSHLRFPQPFLCSPPESFNGHHHV